MEKILYHDSIQIMGGIVFVIFGWKQLKDKLLCFWPLSPSIQHLGGHIWISLCLGVRGLIFSNYPTLHHLCLALGKVVINIC